MLQTSTKNTWAGIERKGSHVLQLMRDVNALEAHQAEQDLTVSIGSPSAFGGIGWTMDREWGSSGGGDDQMNGPTSIEVYGDEVYLLDDGNNRIVVYDLDGNYDRKWSIAATTPDFFIYNDEVYVCDNTNQKITVYDLSGSFQRDIGSSGTGDGQFTAIFAACELGGEIFAGDFFVSGSRIQVFNTSGTYQRKWSTPSGQTPVVLFGYDSEVYVVYNANRIDASDSSGGSSRTVANSLSPLTEMYIYDGLVYLSRGTLDKVSIYDTDGNFVEDVGSGGTGDGEFDGIFGAFFYGGELYVSDNGNDRVQVMIPTSLDTPQDVAAYSSTAVYVTSSSNNRVIKYDEDGNYASTFGSTGTGNGQLDTPKGIATDSSGNVFVVDSGNNRVQKFNSSGVYQSQFGSSGTGNGQFSGPTRIFIDGDDNIYVVDSGNSRVQKFNSSGTYQMQFGSNGTDPGYLSSPVGIVVSADDDPVIYVADAGNDRIQAFVEFSSSAAKFSNTFGENGTGANRQFDAPEGLAIDSSGHIYVTDTANDRIYKLASRGKVVAVYGSNGTDAGEFDSPSGVDVLGNYIFVVDRANNRVQRLTQSSSAGDPADYQTEWKLYLSREVDGSNEVSMGTPDRGLHIPDLGALDTLVPASELDPDAIVIRTTPKYFSVLRRAVEKLAASDVFTNPDTGIVYDWSAGDENLLRRAMSGKWTNYGTPQATGDARRTWTNEAMNYKKIHDIDIGELEIAINRLKKATIGAVT